MFGRKFYVTWEKFEEIDREREFWKIIEDDGCKGIYDAICQVTKNNKI